MRFRLTSLFLAVAILNALAQQGVCSFFTAVASGGGTIPSPNKINQPDLKLHEFVPNHDGVRPGTSGLVYAHAGTGAVSAKAQTFAEGTPGQSTSLDASAIASATYEDVFITAITAHDITAEFVHSIIHFNISGGLSTGGLAAADASVDATFGIGSAFSRGSAGVNSFQGVQTVSSSGFFTGQSVSGADFDVGFAGDFTVGHEFDVSMSITVGAGVGQNGFPVGLASFAAGLFDHTVSFATDRPVFDLPEGYTANSVSANIVDNYWLGDPVPEPTSAVLALIAAAGWSAGSVRRKRR